MRITCPKCQFQGLIDAAPLAFETCVACVRCGETFEARLVEGEILTSLPLKNDEAITTQVDASDSAAESLDDTSVTDDVLVLPQSLEVNYQASEHAPVLEDVLPLPVADAELEAPESTLASQFEETVVTKVFEAQLLDESLSTDASDDGHDFKIDQTLAESAAVNGKQSAGIKLMRISPLWLLVCGVTFISVIILSNQFARSAGQGQHVAMNYTTPDNGTTNPTLPQPPAPANANPVAKSTQDAPSPTVPAQSELKDDAAAIEGKAGSETRDEPKPAPSAAPVVEKKKEEVAARAAQSPDERTGGLTIQVGSYNVIEQANERVARLQSAGFDARVAVVELPKRGTWYRVQAGRFNSREEAARYGNEMKSKGAADNFIITDVESGK